MAKRGKKYTEALKQVDAAKLYSLAEAGSSGEENQHNKVRRIRRNLLQPER